MSSVDLIDVVNKEWSSVESLKDTADVTQSDHGHRDRLHGMLSLGTTAHEKELKISALSIV